MGSPLRYQSSESAKTEGGGVGTYRTCAVAKPETKVAQSVAKSTAGVSWTILLVTAFPRLICPNRVPE
jgi:hypothetical protein